MPTKTKVPPSLKPTSREDLEARREGVVCQGPSGAVYRVRRVNLRRHAFAGGLPGNLVEFALSGDGRRVLREAADGEKDTLEAYQAYLDRLVCATIVDPAITVDDLGKAELEDDPLIPVVDQEWAQDLAFGRTEDDGLGRRIWGPEPLDSFESMREYFAKAHACPPECPRCGVVEEEMQRLFTAAAVARRG